MSQLTPQEKIKWIALARIDGKYKDYDAIIEEFGSLEDAVLYYADEFNDVFYELREGEIETNIRSPLSRYYETQSVAAQAPNDDWVGWTYWYGGGKHSEPESIDWISEAYDLKIVGEKIITVYEFEKV